MAGVSLDSLEAKLMAGQCKQKAAQPRSGLYRKKKKKKKVTLSY